MDKQADGLIEKQKKLTKVFHTTFTVWVQQMAPMLHLQFQERCCCKPFRHAQKKFRLVLYQI